MSTINVREGLIEEQIAKMENISDLLQENLLVDDSTLQGLECLNNRIGSMNLIRTEMFENEKNNITTLRAIVADYIAGKVND